MEHSGGLQKSLCLELMRYESTRGQSRSVRVGAAHARIIRALKPQVTPQYPSYTKLQCCNLADLQPGTLGLITARLLDGGTTAMLSKLDGSLAPRASLKSAAVDHGGAAAWCSTTWLPLIRPARAEPYEGGPVASRKA